MELIEATEVEECDSTWGLAISQSLKSSMKFKIGAVIVKKGKMIGFGYNNNKTHPKYGSKRFKTLHAEGAAIWAAKKLGNDTRGATMVVYRTNARISKPCECCQAIIKKAGISKVIYTNHE